MIICLARRTLPWQQLLVLVVQQGRLLLLLLLLGGGGRQGSAAPVGVRGGGGGGWTCQMTVTGLLDLAAVLAGLAEAKKQQQQQ
jgi:hypothetical protein